MSLCGHLGAAVSMTGMRMSLGVDYEAVVGLLRWLLGVWVNPVGLLGGWQFFGMGLVTLGGLWGATLGAVEGLGYSSEGLGAGREGGPSSLLQPSPVLPGSSDVRGHHGALQRGRVGKPG